MKGEHTKIILAEALMDLMLDKPLDDISIAEIIAAGKLSRRTFYYHFRDIEDLVCWIFDWEVINYLGVQDVIIDKAGQRKYFVDALRNHMYRNRSFYVNAIRSAVGNELRKHIYEFIYGYRHQQILKILGDRVLDPKGIKFLTSYFTHAIVGNTIDWVEEGMPCPPNNLDGGYRDVTTRCMRFILDEYAIDKEAGKQAGPE